MLASLEEIKKRLGQDPCEYIGNDHEGPERIDDGTHFGYYKSRNKGLPMPKEAKK